SRERRKCDRAKRGEHGEKSRERRKCDRAKRGEHGEKSRERRKCDRAKRGEHGENLLADPSQKTEVHHVLSSIRHNQTTGRERTIPADSPFQGAVRGRLH